jgi:ribosomal protein S18 acetylase RimI-like enzyme
VKIEIRDATLGDACALVPLLEQLGYRSTEAQVMQRLEKLASTGRDVCLVAIRGSAVVGVAAAHISATLVTDQPVAKLSALVTDDHHRRQGIGEALVSAVEQRMRANGCSLIFLTTADHRDEAHAFYRRIGFKEAGRRFYRPIPAADDVG